MPGRSPGPSRLSWVVYTDRSWPHATKATRPTPPVPGSSGPSGVGPELPATCRVEASFSVPATDLGGGARSRSDTTSLGPREVHPAGPKHVGESVLVLVCTVPSGGSYDALEGLWLIEPGILHCGRGYRHGTAGESARPIRIRHPDEPDGIARRIPK